MLKRNSGFIIGCVIAAGVSFFAADVVMSDQVTLKLPSEETATEGGTEKQLAPEATESHTYETDPFTVAADGTVIKGVETESPKKAETEQRQTDENGNVITPQTDENGNVTTLQTDENGNVVASTDEAGDGANQEMENGSASDDSNSGTTSGSDSGDTSWDGGYDGSGDGSGSNGNSGGENIEIRDPGNGSYSYNDGSGNNGNSGSNGGGNGNSGSNGGSQNTSGGGGTASTPDDVILWGISSRYIDESELYNYSAGQLRLIRNEIFALHGRIFKSQDLMDYFSQKSWYVPTYDPDDFDAHMFEYLNDYEAANLKVILNYEAALAGN